MSDFQLPIARRTEPQPALIGAPATIGLLVLASAFWARLLVAAGAPGLVKFVHFLVAWVGLIVVLPAIRGESSRRLLVGLFALAAVITLSAALNGAGLVNALLDFLLLSEPFVVLILLTDGPMEGRRIESTRRVIWFLAATSVAMSWYQFLVEGEVADGIRGVFLGQPSAHVNGAIALTFAAWLLVHWNTQRRSATLLVAAAAGLVAFIGDAKQVVAVFAASLMILFCRNLLDRRVASKSMLLPLLLTSLAVVLIATSHRYATRQPFIEAGIEHKLSVFPRIESAFDSPWNWAVGIGPGHTSGRLALLIPDYGEYLYPLGATTSDTTVSLRRADSLNWLAGSSMWSLMFSWAGVWGDLGLLGLCTVGLLWVLVWKDFCRDSLSRLTLLNILLLSVVYSWLEEPAFVLFAIAAIASQSRTVGVHRSHARVGCRHPGLAAGWG